MPASGLKTWRQASGWFCAKRLSGSAAASVPTATWVRGGQTDARGSGSPWVGLPGLIALPQCECHLATNGPGPWGREAGPTGRGCGEERGCGPREPVNQAYVFMYGHGQAEPHFCSSFLLSSWVPTWHFVYEGGRSVFIWFGHQGLMFCARDRVAFVLW